MDSVFQKVSQKKNVNEDAAILSTKKKISTKTFSISIGCNKMQNYAKNHLYKLCYFNIKNEVEVYFLFIYSLLAFW